MKIVAALLLVAACGEAVPEGYVEGEERSGGDTTIFDTSREAYSFVARNVGQARRDPFFIGNSFFNRNWVTAPSSTSGVDGLGPSFNASSCSSCHAKDGRAPAPLGPEDRLVGLLVRISLAGEDSHGGPRPDPRYGDQLQGGAILGVPVEADLRVSWEDVPGEYGDGAPYSLRRPRIEVRDAAFGELGSDVMTSPRVAPAVFGLGLLEAIDEPAILANADDADADGDGISGRPNRVWDAARSEVALGRFGWKANQPTVAQQNAGAFFGDMGITSPIFSVENCPEPQTACRGAPTGGAPEVEAGRLDDIAFYVKTLAVPGRRDHLDSELLMGKWLFYSVGCASCHVASFETSTSAEIPELAGQTIWPYTDLLLHDMGEGLADGRPDYLANGREWRTPPLWGIGLVTIVNRHDNYLHDGRARGFAEAILWHGGEGEAAKERFRAMGAEDRASLIRFLESL